MRPLLEVFDTVQSKTPKSLGSNAWYLATAAALVSLGKPEEIGELSLHLTKNSSSEHKDTKELISKRLRDVLMKEWTLVGIPLVITALSSLAKAEEGQNLEGGLSKKWQNPLDPQGLSERGTTFLQTLYAQNLTPIFSTWGTHRADFEYLEKNIIYGLYLSDHDVLSAIEAEVVILTAIMCQGLPAPTIYHLRGLRRLGISAEDVEALEMAVEAVAEWAGRETSHWPRVVDVVLS
ncbi:hypothetical protein G7Y79_00008g023750 [Physcia stellaris]|nr:hypothetical protein G7Y79_00008g023750 [Physcia stellaris]